MYYTRASAPIKSVKLADPVAVLVARSQARAHLVAAGAMDLQTAVDGLQEAAERTDLVWLIGQDAVQSVMSSAFQTLCPPTPPASEVCPTIRQTSPEPARGPVPTPAPCPLVRTHGVPSASQLQAEYGARIAQRRARYGPAVSTLRAARFLLRLGDPKRLRAWLAEHGPDERIAIRQHLKRAKAKCPA